MGGFIKSKNSVSYELPEYVPEWHKGEGADIWAYAGSAETPAPTQPEPEPEQILSPVEAARKRWFAAPTGSQEARDAFLAYQQLAL